MMNEPGPNNLKALHWVQSHEGCEASEIKWDPWTGHYVEMSNEGWAADEFQAFSIRCYDLFATPLWASEWA